MENWRSIKLDQIMVTTGKKPNYGRGGPNIDPHLLSGI